MCLPVAAVPLSDPQAELAVLWLRPAAADASLRAPGEPDQASDPVAGPVSAPEH